MSQLRKQKSPIEEKKRDLFNAWIKAVWSLTVICLYESLTNMLELKGFRFSLWQVVTAM